MDTLQKHEVFEIEVLERLKSGRFLDPLVFGGGTMLRLCYELNRYSADLDFWFVKKANQKEYFDEFKTFLSGQYEVTDVQVKSYPLLLEIRSKAYPKRLKLEISKEAKECDFQEKIAFSRHSTAQVMVRVHTLAQTMKNKIGVALDRGEIRDFFDIEFLLRRGIIPDLAAAKAANLRKAAARFKGVDFRAFGSVLEPDMRKYCLANKFEYLLQKLPQ